jgi:hypothetical protein
MHTLLKVTMKDMEAANSAISEGRLQKIIQQVSKIISPETSFFTAENGYRTGIFIFDLKDASIIPMIAEPFFTELNAKVEFFPGMDVTELGRGLEAWSKQAPTYTSLS